MDEEVKVRRVQSRQIQFVALVRRSRLTAWDADVAIVLIEESTQKCCLNLSKESACGDHGLLLVTEKNGIHGGPLIWLAKYATLHHHSTYISDL